MKKQSKNKPVVVVPETKEELEKVLTDKQKVFAVEYLKDFNGSAAYIRSGYKGSSKTAKVEASKHLTNPNLLKYINILKTEITTAKKLDIDYIIDNAKEILERCLQHRPVLDSKGNQIIIQTPAGELAAAYIFDSKGGTGALRLLAEHVPNWKVNPDDGDKNKNSGMQIILNNYLGQPNNAYFKITPETAHLAKLLGIETKDNESARTK